MSEHPGDEEELKAFLEGDSGLSRRYREASDEQPPAKVDAAILAAAQWAVGAGPGKGDQRSTEAPPGSPDHGSSGWWDKLFSRWSVPLATTAVVVIAATLALMIERDPELERIESDYDSVASNGLGKRSHEAQHPGAEQTMAEQSAVADADEAAAPVAPGAAKLAESKQAKSEGAVSESTVSNSAKPAPSTPERLKFRPVEQEAPAIAKDKSAGKEAPREDVAESGAAASATGRAEPPAEPAFAGFADDMAQTAAPTATVSEQPAAEEAMVADTAASMERRPDALTAGDIPAAEMASEQATAGVSAEPEAFTETQQMAEPARPTDASSASLDAGLAQEDATGAPSGTRSAQSQTPASSDTRAAGRDPEDWIADIEEQLALGNRELARAAVKNFRERYPDYKLPDALEALLSVKNPESRDSGPGEPGIGNQ